MSSPAEDALRTQTRTALKTAGISQAEACRRLGLSTKHLNQMLVGHANLTLPWAEKLLALCGKRVVITLRKQPKKQPKEPTAVTDPIITDLRRELEKARHALIDAQTHLAAHSEMNAALHCATTVMYSPLHAKVTAAIQQTEHALLRTEQANVPTLDYRTPEGAFVALVADLDRCMHGRHEGDNCGSCPEGVSLGNPHMPVGEVIGYGLRGAQIVMPGRDDKHDPAAWRATPTSEEPTP